MRTCSLPLLHSSPPPGARGTSYLGRRRFSCLQIASHAPSGESRTSAPTRSAALLGEAAYTDVSRSTPVGVAVRSLERLAIRLGYRQAGDRYWLAPQRLPAVLDLEGSPRSARPAADFSGGSETDPHDEPRKSAVGRTPHPRRIAQTRHRYRRDQRRHVDRTHSEPAVAKLADIPGESRQDHGVGRLLHRPDHPVSGPVRV